MSLLITGPEGELEGSLIKGSSRLLAKNMVEEGAVRGAGEVAHHVVAKAARFARGSVKILQRLGIDIDHAANGVFLKASQHAKLHTKAYYSIRPLKNCSRERRPKNRHLQPYAILQNSLEAEVFHEDSSAGVQALR